MRFHPEVLDPRQDEVLTSAGAAVAERGYRLGGGTAFALVFRHRESVDFDGFSEAVLLSLDDFGCMKLSAIAQRGSRKDFVDLFVLGREHRPLDELLELYQRKFEVREIGHLLYSLVYFEDAERDRMPGMLWDATWEQVREQVEDWVRGLARRR